MPPTTTTPALAAPAVVAPGVAGASNFPEPSAQSDWLPNLIIAAKLIKDTGEVIPVPYVKAAFGIVVTLLETVQKVKQNREDWKEVCGSAVEIVQHVSHAIEFHGDAMAVRFKELCNGLQSFLEEIQQHLEKINRKQAGFKGRWREVFKAENIGAEILGYKERIRELRSNFLMVASIEHHVSLAKVDQKVSKVDQDLSALAQHMIPGGWVLDQSVLPLRECPPPSPIFHGRKEVLDKMHAYFAQNAGRRKVFVLFGLGGAGKTQTGLKFVEQSSQLGRFSDVFFIDSSTLGTIDLSFRSLAVAKHAGNTAEHALQWMVTHQTEWLLLFNNADDTSINIRNFMPRCTHGNIVITTRNPELRVHAPDSHHRLSDMEEVDAVVVLLQGSLNKLTTKNVEVASKIVQVLHCFPLAVVQAGAFICKYGGLEQYLDRYKQNKARLLKDRPAQTQDDYGWTVYTTWQISFDHLSKPAARLLELCSLLHHEGITETLFSKAVLYASTELGELDATAEDLSDAREFLAHFLTPAGRWDQLYFAEVTTEIRGYSLMEQDLHKESYSIHPFVHDWTKSSLADAQHTWKCMVTILGMSADQQNDHRFQIQLLPHIDSLMHGGKEGDMNFQFTFGRICRMGGRPVEAQHLLSNYAVKSRQQFGDDHPATLNVLGHLACSYSDLGKIQDAADLEAVVLEKMKQLLGDRHPDTLIAMGNLASSYSDLGRTQDAADLEAVVLERRKQLLGKDHPDTLVAMGNLASSYGALGRTQDAADLEAVVLKKMKQLLGDGHPDTLIAMGNLASSYSDLGRTQDAADLEAVVLEKMKQLLGDEHPDTLVAMGNLACSCSDLGRTQDAADLEVMVLEKRKKLLGDEHPDTLITMGNLASSYSALGRPQDAAELKATVLEKRKQLLGEDHPHTLVAMGNLACSYSDLGRTQDAADLEAMVLKRRKKLLGDEHPDTLRAKGNLASSYSALGRTQDAADLQAMVLKKRKQLLGEDHPDTLITMGNLASSYSALGRTQDAADLEAVVLKKRQQLLGEDHPDTLLAMGNLAHSYSDLGRTQDAADLEVVVLEKMKQLLGEEHPDTLITMGNLASSYRHLGRTQDAVDLEAMVLEKRKNIGRN
ncbi:hypothetical protein DFH09DRAFT_1279616 [Mycena vulgaris]|nr:hypothetical protein DFH09DRAFT_1279616 [Mycena vulgaris]